MPTISMFYGILVAILFEDNDRHNLPHIHVRYAGSKASIASYSPTGSSPLPASSHSASPLCSRRQRWKCCWMS